MELFRPDITGTFLYLDLDTVVRKLPDAYFQYPQSLALDDFMQSGQKPRSYRGSGMMLLHEKDRAQVWEQWIADPARHMREHRGDQDFLYSAKLNTATWQSVFPGEICSYKMHWLPKRGVEEKKVNVVCFHGRPKPWELPEMPAMLQRQPQSCVLVGNGPSILNHQLGTVIDGFDEVVRFNAFAIRGFEDRVGTKTTLWSTFGHKTLPKDEAVRPERVLFTHGAGGEPAYSPKELIRIPASAYSLVRKLLQTRSKLPETGDLIPSSGLLVAWWYLEAMRMPKISLIGFDHFSKASDSRHHYWNPQIFTKPKEHDGEAEAAIIQDYIGAGRIERLG